MWALLKTKESQSILIDLSIIIEKQPQNLRNSDVILNVKTKK
jgi:hypothetical protein